MKCLYEVDILIITLDIFGKAEGAANYIFSTTYYDACKLS